MDTIDLGIRIQDTNGEVHHQKVRLNQQWGVEQGK